MAVTVTVLLGVQSTGTDMGAADQTKPPPPPPSGGEDDIIELTEVVAENPAEVVLALSPGSDDLDSLKPPAPSPEEPQKAPAPPGQQESLDDFLVSLPELPEDLDIPAEAPPLGIQPSQDLRQELAQRLGDMELKDLVREVIQETVTRLARELLPEMAAATLDKEMQLLKKRLAEPE